jgi:hypothetical protein
MPYSVSYGDEFVHVIGFAITGLASFNNLADIPSLPVAFLTLPFTGLIYLFMYKFITITYGIRHTVPQL